MGMDKLQLCLATYDSMLNSRYRVFLKNGSVLEFFFTGSNLPHLLGLHKLKDISKFQKSTSNQIYKMLVSGEITYKNIHRSNLYNHIANRIEYFHLLPMMTQSKFVVKFDPSKVKNTELTETKYILYIKRPEGVFHLTLGEKTTKSGVQQYPETFFFDSSKLYITDQELLEVEKLEVIHLK